MANDSDSQLSIGGGQQSSSGSSVLSTIGSVVGAISNPIGSVISWLANKDAAKERNNFAIEQWKRENAYNHPASQVARLKSAGLNPALMYENGASGLVSASSPDMAVPSPANFQGIDPLTAAQIANLNAQTQATEDANSRENAKQDLTIQQMEKYLEKTKKEISSFELQWNLLIAQDHYYSRLGDKTAYEAGRYIRESQMLFDNIVDWEKSVVSQLRKGTYDAEKARIESEKLADQLESLINLNWAHVDYYKKAGDAASSRAESYSNEVANKLREIEGQLDRWDDMTINERIEMGVSLFGQLLNLGKTLFTTSRVTETIKNSPNGTTKSYSRKRSSKN